MAQHPRPSIALAITLAFSLTGCATVDPSELGLPDIGSGSPGAEEARYASGELDGAELRYVAPARGAGDPVVRTVAQPWRDAVIGVAEQLQRDGMRIAHLDAQRGVVVARYRGAPQPFVDCGLIDASGERVPAASSTIAAKRPVQGYSGGSSVKELELDALVTVAARPERGATQLRAEADYVLTKSVSSYDAIGSEVGRRVEVIDFETDRIGEFASGARCVATGELERAAAKLAPSATTVAAIEPAAGLLGSICAPSANDPRGYCEALSIADFLDAGEVEVEISERSRRGKVALDIRSGDASGEFYLMRMRPSGVIEHVEQLFLDGETRSFRLETEIDRADLSEGDVFLAIVARDRLDGGRAKGEAAAIDRWLSEFKSSLDAQPGVVTGGYVEVRG